MFVLPLLPTSFLVIRKISLSLYIRRMSIAFQLQYKLLPQLLFATIFLGGNIGCRKETALQWEKVENPDSTATLYSVFVLSQTDAWAVGDSGTIIHWNGEEWKHIDSPTNILLNKILFTEDQGYILCNDATLLVKSDTNWLIKEFPIGIHSPDMCFINKEIGWVIIDTCKDTTVVGPYYADAILYTTNAGEDWVINWIGEPLNRIIFITSDIGWAIGRAQFPYLYSTTDGGETWVWQEIEIQPYCLTFKNINQGYCAGGGGILFTNDGKEWTVTMKDENICVYDLIFFNVHRGVACGVMCSGKEAGKVCIIWTIDGGSSWDYEIMNEYCVLYSISMDGENSGWAVGSKGTIIRFFITKE